MSTIQSPPVVYVEHKGNASAIAGFVCGLTGAVFGLIPILAVPALILGLVGTTFGAIGWRAVASDPSRGHKGLAIAGTLLGIAAVGLAIVGFVIVANAFDS